MIDADFSRRVGRLMHTPVIESQTLEERLEFVKTIDKMENFDSMPSKYQDLIIEAEKQRIEMDDRPRI